MGRRGGRRGEGDPGGRLRRRAPLRPAAGPGPALVAARPGLLRRERVEVAGPGAAAGLGDRPTAVPGRGAGRQAQRRPGQPGAGPADHGHADGVGGDGTPAAPGPGPPPAPAGHHDRGGGRPPARRGGARGGGRPAPDRHVPRRWPGGHRAGRHRAGRRRARPGGQGADTALSWHRADGHRAAAGRWCSGPTPPGCSRCPEITGSGPDRRGWCSGTPHWYAPRSPTGSAAVGEALRALGAGQAGADPAGGSAPRSKPAGARTAPT